MVLWHMPACFGWLYTTMLLGFPLDQVAKCLLTTPVQYWIGWRFHRGAYVALRGGRCARAAACSYCPACSWGSPCCAALLR